MMDFDLCYQPDRIGYYNLLYNSPCESAVSQFNVPTDFAVKVVTMHTLLYGGNIEYDFF